MKPIDNWKHAWKMFSVQCNAIGVALSAQYALMYDQLKDTIPPKVMIGVTGLVFIVGIISRIVYQPKLPRTKDKE